MRRENVVFVSRCMLVGAALLVSCATLQAQTWRNPPEVLPGTDRLSWTDPLDVRLMDGAHRYIERKIAESVAGRPAHWKRDFTSPAAYDRSVAANRQRLRTIVGAVNRGNELNHNIGLPASRLPLVMERVTDDQCPAVVLDAATYRISRVRWPVLHGVHGEGLLLEPKEGVTADVVTIPDADQAPELLAGLVEGLPPERQVARRLAENGYRVVVPTLISRGPVLEGNAQQTEREWIYRQAFHMGRHVIGYEIEKIEAAIDWLTATSTDDRPIGVAGYGEGGLLSLYVAALDTRVNVSLVSGYFCPREQIWSEPIYRNLWSLLCEFGDAEIGSLVAPRSLIIEYSPVPAVTDQKGELRTPALAQVQREADRIEALTRPGFQKRRVISGPGDGTIGPWSDLALQAFAAQLCGQPMRPTGQSATPVLGVPDARARMARQLRELDDYTQWLVRDSDHVRSDFFLYKLLPEFKRPPWSTKAEHPTSSAEEFARQSGWYRAYFWEEVLGKLDDPLLPFQPRTRLIADKSTWVAYDVVLDVFPDLIAWGILMVPKDLADGQQRPVVVLQHGRNGLPENVMNGGYNDAAGRLLERGFIVFAPHNLYRGEDRYRWLDRKANSVKASLFSFIIAQHDQITRWMASLPYVDGQRIGFYGNSYGGETAVRVPTIIERYALSICASDFNDWTRKVADTHDWHSFMNTIEWEMPYFNMGSTFSYAEMAYLMVPRPFMVERGHHDLVAPDSWVAYEFAKVRWLYDQLGLADRRRIDFFQGGHTMKGDGTFEFLSKHLGPTE